MNSGETPPRSHKRRTILRATAGGLGLSWLAGCQGVGGDDRSLRIAQVVPPVDLDPITLSDVSSAQIAARVFEGLYSYDDGTNIVPELAAGAPDVNDTGTTYKVAIDEDAQFQNGDPVGATDVVYSFEAPAKEETPHAWTVEMIDTVSAIDDQTVEFSLEYPYDSFGQVLTRPIVPRAERESNPQAFGRRNPVGSGPFRVETFTSGKRAYLTRWDNYWGASTPVAEAVTFVPVHSSLARVMSLKTGQNDLVERVPPKLWSVTERMSEASVRSTDGFLSHFVGFNCNEGPATDPLVREAVAHCFDTDEAVSNFVEPSGVRQHSPIPDRVAEAWDFPLSTWKDIPRGKNLDRTRSLLNQADVSDWAPTIAVPGTKNSGDKLRETFAEAVVHGLGEVGLRRARVKKYPTSEFREKTVSGIPSEYDMYVRACSATPDPDSVLYPQFHENNEGTTNGVFYNEEDVMEDILAARRSNDREERRKRYASAITTLLEEWACLPAYTLKSSFGVKDSVDDFRPHPIVRENPRLQFD